MSQGQRSNSSTEKIFEDSGKCVDGRASRNIWTDKLADSYGFIFLMLSSYQHFWCTISKPEMSSICNLEWLICIPSQHLLVRFAVRFFFEPLQGGSLVVVMQLLLTGGFFPIFISEVLINLDYYIYFQNVMDKQERLDLHHLI